MVQAHIRPREQGGQSGLFRRGTQRMLVEFLQEGIVLLPGEITLGDGDDVGDVEGLRILLGQEESGTWEPVLSLTSEAVAQRGGERGRADLLFYLPVADPARW